MERKRAELYKQVLFCPLCDFVASNRNVIVNHLVIEHSDKEAIEELEWA